MSCGCVGRFYKPRYKRHVDLIYPRDPKDEKLIRADMDKLLCYTLQHPEKLDRIGEYFSGILSDSLYHERNGWVKVSIDAIVELLKACHAQRINLFISSYLKMVQLLLESSIHDYRRYGTSAFENFSKIEEEGANYDRNYDLFIKLFCGYCYDDSKSTIERKEMRICGIQGIQGVLRKMIKNQLTDKLLINHSELVIPSLLYNMQEGGEDIVSGNNTPSPDSPRYLSEEVIGEILSCITLSQVSLVISPLLKHCDNHKLWETENAIIWAELFMKSVRETYRQNIVKLILEHSDNDGLQNEKKIFIKKAILNVVSEIATIPDKNIMGTIGAELIAIIIRGIDCNNLDPQLIDQYVITCRVIISHLEDFVQIEILQNMIDSLPKMTNVSPLLQAIHHSCSSFKPTKENELAIFGSIVTPLLKVSNSRLSYFCADDRCTIGHILLSAIDTKQNLSSLSRAGSWNDPSGFTLSKRSNLGISIRTHLNNLTLWIYENMKLEDNTTKNYLLYYQIIGVLLIEVGGEVVVQIVKILLALQDEMSTGDLFEHAYKCQTHSCIGSSLRLISSFYECLLPAVQEVINERNHNRPQLAPNAMFSGSSDALRRSTASLYSPRDDPHIEKYLFKRQSICEALICGGFDVSSLADPLSLMTLDEVDNNYDLDAESIQLSINEEEINPTKKITKQISFSDIYKAYQSVPQTLDELNKRDAKQLEKLQKMEFQQIVSELEESRRVEAEIMNKILKYSTELESKNKLTDYQESTYPDLFVY